MGSEPLTQVDTGYAQSLLVKVLLTLTRTYRTGSCEDEVDQEIPRLLNETGSPGLLPKDLARKLEDLKVRRHQVTHRIKRMNKQLEKEGW